MPICFGVDELNFDSVLPVLSTFYTPCQQECLTEHSLSFILI